MYFYEHIQQGTDAGPHCKLFLELLLNNQQPDQKRDYILYPIQQRQSYWLWRRLLQNKKRQCHFGVVKASDIRHNENFTG